MDIMMPGVPKVFTNNMAMGIYKGLPHELQDKCFCMPVFMDYLVQTKLVENWGYALFDTLLTAKKIYEAGEDDLIIIGKSELKSV